MGMRGFLLVTERDDVYQVPYVGFHVFRKLFNDFRDVCGVK